MANHVGIMEVGFLQNSVPPDWRAMRPERAAEEIRAALAGARKNLDKIREAGTGGSAPTYAGTVRALDRATDSLDRAWTYLNHLQSVADTPQLRAALNELMPEVADFYSSIDLDDGLYAAVKNFSETPEGKSLTGDKKRLLGETILDFEFGGAGLPPEKKARLRDISAMLAVKTQKFSENVLDDMKRFVLCIDSPQGLSGLPETAVALAKKKAEEKNLEGWAFTLDQPLYVPFMTYADSDANRMKLWRWSSSVASSGEFSNWDLIREILSLRDEKARILSRANFADAVLERRMAKSGRAAENFVDLLSRRFSAPFRDEWDELVDFARLSGYLKDGEKMPPWRTAYVSEKLRAARYGFDPEQMRPYFPLESVLSGMFGICEKLFGLRIKKSLSPRPSWHESVETYEVFFADGSLCGVFYADLFPRPQKRSGAWMNILSQRDGDSPALGVIAANISEGTDGAPPLLSMDEVETLFHEFGHLVHFFLMDSPEMGLRDVAWDFVELPSQIMENWCHDKSCLDIFARHWKTGEKMPGELFEKFDASRKFMGASASMRQLSFAKIDLAMHTDARRFISSGDIEAEARKILAPYSCDTSEPVPSILPRFTHLFGDSVGYAAGYYSYKWAEVLDADAFSRFEREGILNPEVGREFAEKILKVGNSVDPAEAFRNFMGRDPDISALVERSIETKKA